MNWPAYPCYRAVRARGLPPIPNEWDIAQIKRLGTIRYGIGEPPRYVETGTPLIRATNVSAGQITGQGLVYVDPNDIPAQRIIRLQVDDIVVVRSGAYAGDSARVSRRYVGAIAGFDMVLTVKGAVPAFVQYALLSGYLKQGQIDIVRTRAAQPHLNAEELGACWCVLPPVEVQHLVVDFLDRETNKIDALIRKQESLIASLREDRTATVTHAVTRGLDPDAEVIDSGVPWLGWMPRHWAASRLKNVVDSIESGTSVNGQDTPAGADEVGVLKTSSVSGGSFNAAANKTVVHEDLARVTCPVQNETVIVNRANTPLLVGSAAYVACAPRDLYLSDKLWQVRFDGALPAFVYFWTQTQVYRSQIASSCVGASSSMQNLSMSDFRNVAIALPPVADQQAIVNYLSARTAVIDALIAQSNKVIEVLREYRLALITNAVTGEINVEGVVG